MKRLQIPNPWPEAPVYFKKRTISTMEDARRLFFSGCPDGTVVLTDFQKSGRGRIPDRSWTAQAGRNLLFTLVLGADSGPEQIGTAPQRIPLLAGLALALSIEELYGLSGQLKWPNDLLVEGKKVAGILCEALTEGSRMGVLIGIGLNCNQVGFPDDLEAKATSLALALDRGVNPLAILPDVLSRLKSALRDEDWHAKVAARLYGKDRKVCLSFPATPGRNDELGAIRGLNRDGALLFQPDSSGEQPSPPIAVYSGEIRFVEEGE
jgi:BirA family biotin operon repressor/biotin-[acetyl-CoA-carboxylase] ligase